MSKISAEIELKQGNISDAAKGVARQIEGAFAPIKRGQVAAKMLQNSFKPITQIAVSAAAGVALVGGAALAVGGGIAVGVKKALDMGGVLSDLSARTGASAGGLMVMQQAFENAGMSADNVGPAMNRMQKALSGANEEGDSTTSMFERLGLNMADLQSMKPDQQFQTVAKAIAKLSDPSARAAAAMGLFGKSGGEMLAIFNDPQAFGTAADQVGKQAELMNRNAALFDGISDKLALAGLKVQGFFVGVADRVAPVLLPLLDRFAQLDLATQGQGFGNAIAGALDEFTAQNPGKTLCDWTVYAGEFYANALIDGVQKAVKLLSNVPGLGVLGKIEMQKWDTSWRDKQMQDSATRVQSLRDSFRATDKTAEGVGLSIPGSNDGGGGSRPSVSRMFSTSAGLFVKDPILAESRKQSDLLSKINTGIAVLKDAKPVINGAIGVLKFS